MILRPFTERPISELADPAAADDYIAVVEDCRLAWRDGALRLVEGDEHLVVI